jgi:hypothetical protein
MWHDWLRRRFAQNVPYDELVRGILTATSRGDARLDDWIDQEAALIYAARAGFDAPYADHPALDLFWRRGSEQAYPAEDMAELVASSFLGVRIGCARCHAHPFDRWTQQDFRSLANVFAQVRFGMSPELRAALFDRLEQRRALVAAGEEPGPALPRLREVYLAEAVSDLTDPSTAVRLAPRALDGPILEPVEPATSPPGGPRRDRRVALMDWLAAPDNPYFARNIVNRVWAHYFGRGLVEPLDGFSTANPPSHPELLDALAADFVESGYDLRRLERLILNSTTWQLSSTPNEANASDRRHFSRAEVRLPSADVLIDMWRAAAGATPRFGDDVPAGIHAVEIGPSRLGNGDWDRLFTILGRSPRTQRCDCHPPPGPSIRQTLALMSDPTLLAGLSAGRLPALLDAKLSDAEVVDELFLSALSRLPGEDERRTACAHVSAAASRAQAFEDILWGLLNTQEFVTIH